MRHTLYLDLVRVSGEEWRKTKRVCSACPPDTIPDTLVIINKAVAHGTAGAGPGKTPLTCPPGMCCAGGERRKDPDKSVLLVHE